MPQSVRSAFVGVWDQAVLNQAVLPGIAFPLVVLRGFSAAEVRNWFDR